MPEVSAGSVLRLFSPSGSAIFVSIKATELRFEEEDAPTGPDPGEILFAIADVDPVFWTLTWALRITHNMSQQPTALSICSR